MSEPLELVAIETLSAAVMFAEGGAEAVMAAIEAKVRAIDIDISTPKGRAACASLARLVSSTKVKLDDVGKDYVAELKQKAKVVDTERKLLRDRHDTLRDEVRAPLDAFEAKQQARIDEHQAELDKFSAATMFDEIEPAAAAIQDRLDRVRSIGGNRDWEEFQKRADTARETAIETLTAMLEVAKRREAERAELDKLRLEQIEREQRDRIAKAKQDATDAANAKAAIEQQRLQREKREAEELARSAVQRQQEAEERAARAAEEAAAAERQRIADEQAAAKRESDKREANKRHRAKIHSAIKLALIERARLDEAVAVAVVKAIASGEIPHVTINY